jgi:hypothetical protein
MPFDIASDLIHVAKAHIDIHGATAESGRFIRANIALWAEQFGNRVAEKVRNETRGYFMKKAKEKKEFHW